MPSQSLRVLVCVLCVIALGSVLGACGGGGGGRPKRLSGDIGDYLALPGNQVVKVRDGTYTARKVVPTSRRTGTSGGRLHGWLVLVAESPHQVTVDLSGHALELGPGEWKVLFVGFRFVNGTIAAAGRDLAFWYADVSFPPQVWEKQSYYSHARPFDADYTTTNNIALYGVDLRDASTLLRCGHSTNVLLEGARLYGSTQTVLGHNDAISCRGGAKGSGSSILISRAG